MAVHGILMAMSTRFRYFPEDNATGLWGLCLRSVGWQQTLLESEYPIRQHPDSYYYTWDTGRRLSEHQLALVFSGSGVVEFERGKPNHLPSGTLFLLPQGQWHRCMPDALTGWGTLWFGFNGAAANAVVRSVFHDENRFIKPLAKAKEFKYAAMRFIAGALKNGVDRPFSMIGDLVQILGRLADGEFDDVSSPGTASLIRNAECEIARRCTEIVDFRKLATSLGLSYDAFRHRFAAEAGMSPLQFLLAERLRIAKNLVINTNLPIAEIARRTGFSSPAYFTRFFKEGTKMPPGEYRQIQATST